MAMSEAHKRMLKVALKHRANGLGIVESIAAAKKNLYHPHRSKSVSTKYGGPAIWDPRSDERWLEYHCP